MTYPPVFDGIGAMFVRTDNDPDVQLARIKPTPTWVAVKVNGGDIQTQPEIRSWLERVHASHPSIHLGVWVYNYGPPKADVSSWSLFYSNPEFVIYDVEAEYKTDEAGPGVAGWPAELVAAHPPTVAAAVTSYGAIPGEGKWPSTIDFRPFVGARWPIVAQCYDAYAPDIYPHAEDTYGIVSGGTQPAYPGPYPMRGVHRMLRSLALDPGEAVYRPEGIDS